MLHSSSPSSCPSTPHSLESTYCCEHKQNRTSAKTCRQSSVTEMLQKLKWDSLQERRARSQLIMLYKIQHQLVAIPATTYLVPSTRSTRGHDIRYLQPHTRILVYKYNVLVLPDSNQALEHFTSNCSWISDSGTVYQRYYRDQINTRSVAALMQKINCLHIISANKTFLACTKKYYY